MFKPGYLKLYSTGELYSRMQSLNKILESCTICPRCCKINRNYSDKGYCHSNENAIVASYGDHHGEETPLSGYNGSGTIFFGNCNLKCVFCQNHDISQNFSQLENYKVSNLHLADIMLYLQNIKHCHNINFVSPSHFVPQIVEAVYIATEKGLRIPLVFNSNAYDSLEVIKLLNGIIDIYLPDIKYSNDQLARKYSGIKSYRSISRLIVKEMFNQVGLLKVDKNGIAQKGLIIRHLVLPNKISGTSETLQWIADELSNQVTVNLMAQYYPAHHANKIALLNRPIKQKEFDAALKTYYDLGFNDELLNPINPYIH